MLTGAPSRRNENAAFAKPSIPLETVRRPRDAPIRKLEAALKYWSCKKGRCLLSVHILKLTLDRARSRLTSG
jgi:hypothetical protein